ncbi:Guanine nucleotide exchange factor lte1 [Dimargaris verticillata]|uniref:Guanine nucleotide exchange factor lte1 n=1 Tax=Dimargaris verticillata TaxID=2761393 RepID=A0A9W8B3E4_9FUNG|nr:Guanine nucleotide exchange factor lte1 [Dimargaris verticillata]
MPTAAMSSDKPSAGSALLSLHEGTFSFAHDDELTQLLASFSSDSPALTLMSGEAPPGRTPSVHPPTQPPTPAAPLSIHFNDAFTLDIGSQGPIPTKVSPNPTTPRFNQHPLATPTFASHIPTRRPSPPKPTSSPSPSPSPAKSYGARQANRLPARTSTATSFPLATKPQVSTATASPPTLTPPSQRKHSQSSQKYNSLTVIPSRHQTQRTRMFPGPHRRRVVSHILPSSPEYQRMAQVLGWDKKNIFHQALGLNEAGRPRSSHPGPTGSPCVTLPLRFSAVRFSAIYQPSYSRQTNASVVQRQPWATYTERDNRLSVASRGPPRAVVPHSPLSTTPSAMAPTQRSSVASRRAPVPTFESSAVGHKCAPSECVTALKLALPNPLDFDLAPIPAWTPQSPRRASPFKPSARRSTVKGRRSAGRKRRTGHKKGLCISNPYDVQAPTIEFNDPAIFDRVQSDLDKSVIIWSSYRTVDRPSQDRSLVFQIKPVRKSSLLGQIRQQYQSLVGHSTSRPEATREPQQPGIPSSARQKPSYRNQSRQHRLTLIPNIHTASQLPGVKMIMAATVEKLIQKLTTEVDYAFLSDFFLTFREFLEPMDLCRLLFLRFAWATTEVTAQDETADQQQRIADNNHHKLVRIRLFIVLRFWLKNYFLVDFIHSRLLRYALTEHMLDLWANNPLCKESPREARILSELEKIMKELAYTHFAPKVPAPVITKPGPQPWTLPNDWSNAQRELSSNTMSRAETLAWGPHFSKFNDFFHPTDSQAGSLISTTATLHSGNYSGGLPSTHWISRNQSVSTTQTLTPTTTHQLPRTPSGKGPTDASQPLPVASQYLGRSGTPLRPPQDLAFLPHYSAAVSATSSDTAAVPCQRHPTASSQGSGILEPTTKLKISTIPLSQLHAQRSRHDSMRSKKLEACSCAEKIVVTTFAPVAATAPDTGKQALQLVRKLSQQQSTSAARANRPIHASTDLADGGNEAPLGKQSRVDHYFSNPFDISFFSAAGGDANQAAHEYDAGGPRYVRWRRWPRFLLSRRNARQRMTRLYRQTNLYYTRRRFFQTTDPRVRPKSVYESGVQTGTTSQGSYGGRRGAASPAVPSPIVTAPSTAPKGKPTFLSRCFNLLSPVDRGVTDSFPKPTAESPELPNAATHTLTNTSSSASTSLSTLSAKRSGSHEAERREMSLPGAKQGVSPRQQRHHKPAITIDTSWKTGTSPGSPPMVQNAALGPGSRARQAEGVSTSSSPLAISGGLGMLPSPEALSTAGYRSQVLYFRSEFIAQQLCIMECEYLQQISWRDLIELRWQKKRSKAASASEPTTEGDDDESQHHSDDGDSPVAPALSAAAAAAALDCGVSRVIRRFDRMSQWVITEIVKTQDQQERALVVEKFIRIALKCYYHANFSSLMQILFALQSSPILRLKDMWNHWVSDYESQVFQHLKEFASPNRNWKNLRDATKVMLEIGCGYELGEMRICHSCSRASLTIHDNPHTVEEVYQRYQIGGCVPFLGLFLSDLVMSAEHPTYIKPRPASTATTRSHRSGNGDRSSTALASQNRRDDGSSKAMPAVSPPSLVNFHKLRNSAAIIKRLIAFQTILAHRYPFMKDPVLYPLLQEENLDIWDEERVMAQSRDLE